MDSFYTGLLLFWCFYMSLLFISGSYLIGRMYSADENFPKEQ